MPLSPYDLQLLINARKTLMDKSNNARKDVLKRIYTSAAKMIEAGIAQEGGFRLIDSPGGTTWERMTAEEHKAITEAVVINKPVTVELTDLKPGTVVLEPAP